MKGLSERIKKWDNSFYSKNMGNSLAIPFEGLEDFFSGQSVLEIGPGEGRQFEIASKESFYYAVADISKNVLACDCYKDIPKYLITDYNCKMEPVLGTSIEAGVFSTIHFWYVIHHVCFEEILSFVSFLSKHCAEDGFLLFNTPVTDAKGDLYEGDGIGTTKWELDELVHFFKKGSFELRLKNKIWHDNSTGYVVIFQKGK